MSDFMDKAKDFANKHDKQIDRALEKGGEMANKRTGGKYDDQIDKAVDRAQARTGEGDQAR
ncbi:antitoxin [Micromonospora avicenniae]|uniref:MT0933-like antitoxin protein n=1 Tax=Micromonospora avicenniae TaxID=1198245 RepID=A0A1N6Z4F4_9ACTN|nr:antitoxin [Micromonospora avicenniae]SIR21703.1 MT0933-like antitoxin protein [Micromonospora avicenniae]